MAWLKTTPGFISRFLFIRSPSSAWFRSAVSSGLIRSNSRCGLGCLPLWRLWGGPHFVPHSGLWENPVCSSCRVEVLFPCWRWDRGLSQVQKASCILHGAAPSTFRPASVGPGLLTLQVYLPILSCLLLPHVF